MPSTLICLNLFNAFFLVDVGDEDIANKSFSDAWGSGSLRRQVKGGGGGNFNGVDELGTGDPSPMTNAFKLGLESVRASSEVDAWSGRIRRGGGGWFLEGTAKG